MKSYHMIGIALLPTKFNPTKSFSIRSFSIRSFSIITSSSRIGATKRWCQVGSEQKLHDVNGRVYITSSDNIEHETISRDIAKRLDVPYIPGEANGVCGDSSASYEHSIHIVPYQFQNLDTYAIAIQPVDDNNSKSKRNGRRQKNNKMQPFYIDFCPSPNSKMGKRIEKQSQQKGGESLLKAAALKKINEHGNGAIVYDLNAGFGQDSTLFAMGGASKVYMVERDPIVGLLLSDALRRLQLVSNLEYAEFDCQHNGVISRAKDLNVRLSLHIGDSIEFAKETRQLISEPGTNHNVTRPDICYLDPMFPPRTKSSAVKKNMQILHGLFQHDGEEEDKRHKDEQRLLEEALLLAKRRVVVKRPINALPLGVQKGVSPEVKMPSYELNGSINRFDVYVIS